MALVGGVVVVVVVVVVRVIRHWMSEVVVVEEVGCGNIRKQMLIVYADVARTIGTY